MSGSYFHACQKGYVSKSLCDPIYKDQGRVVPKRKIKVLLRERREGSWASETYGSLSKVVRTLWFM